MILVPAQAEGVSYTSGPHHRRSWHERHRSLPQRGRTRPDKPDRRAQRRLGADHQPVNHERVALTSSAPLTQSLAQVREWAQQTKNPDGQRVIDTEWVQIALGRAHARVEALSLINWKLASDADAGVDLSPAEASATKIYGSELATEVYRSLMEIVGPNAGVAGDSAGAVSPAGSSATTAPHW